MTIRSFGLSGSGIDVDMLVKEMMAARRESYDKVWQKKTQLEWKKADFNTIYNTIKNFRDTTAFNYRLTSTTIPKKIVSSADNVVTATANADAANVSHSINVQQLAEGASLTSNEKITTGGSKNSLATQLGLEEGTFELVLSDGKNEKRILVDTTKSIYDFVSDINRSGLDIKASYDTNLDRFYIGTTGTGESVKVDFSKNFEEDNIKAKEFIEKLNLFESGDSSYSVQGKDAVVVLDNLEIKQSGNTFTAFGVTYNLKSVGNANITVSADNDQAIKAVKDFIEQYNSLLETINKELKEPLYRDYVPLTDEQKSALSDSQIEKWEEMARSGLLRNDATLQNLLYKLRSDVATPVSGIGGKYNSLASIGVNTGDYTEGGKLYLDENKLKEALEADPDIIHKLFASSGDDRNSQGIAVRFYDTIKGTMDSIKETAGIVSGIDGDTESTLAQQIRDYEESLRNMNQRLNKIEDRYYKQFSSMELALSKLVQQSNFIYSMFFNQ